MMTRRIATVALVGLSLAATAATAEAASYRTRNFVVQAPTPQLAQEFGQLAEHFRKAKAMQWLGYEMPAWPQPCPLLVKVTAQGAGGATTFNFGGNSVSQSMNIEGNLDRLRDSVLPHEVTHTVFAHHFRRPVPRWADEGGSVLSEDDVERKRHDRMCRQLLNAGRGMPLRRLFGLSEYPRDVMVLYAQGYSITQYLIDLKGRQHFLNFVGIGLSQGWENAVRQTYGYDSVKSLEKEWIEYLRKPESLVAYKSKAEQGAGRVRAQNEETLVTREFTPPGRLRLSPPTVARGASPEETSWSSNPVRMSRPAEPAPEPKAAARRSPVILLPPEPISFR